MSPDEPVAGVEPRRRELDCAAEPAALERVHELIDELWRDDDTAPALRMRFELAVVEIVTNVVEHSRALPDGRSRVQLVAGREGPRAYATVVDDGRVVPFDPTESAMPGVEAERGRGLALIRTVCDEFTYRRLPDGNEWTIACVDA